MPVPPSEGQHTDGTDTEEDEGGGFGDGRQEKGIVCPQVYAIANNLPGIVDGSCIFQCPAGGWSMSVFRSAIVPLL